MRLPGTRYQEHGWEQVRKLLGECSLAVLRQADACVLLAAQEAASALDWYADGVGRQLQAHGRRARGTAPANSYGDDVAALAMLLVVELQAQAGHWRAFLAAVAAEHARSGAYWRHASGQAMLRKQVNDMYAVLRDKVDSDNYQAASGRPCSPNKIYTYRMLDTSWRALAQLFDNWAAHKAQLGYILGREIDAFPIEVRQMQGMADCRPEWLIRWSESQERFSGAAGPLHTRSKRFASLKNQPDKIADMLREIGDYGELSAHSAQEWALDEAASLTWLDDLQRVSEAAQEPLSPAPGNAAMAVLQAEALPVRLAVFQSLLGSSDDSYPQEWLEADSGALPSMERLARMAGVSVPTLRKRRNAAIARLNEELRRGP